MLPRCSLCGSPEAVAFRPGAAPYRCAGILVARGTPDAARCLACWPPAAPPSAQPQIMRDTAPLPEQ